MIEKERMLDVDHRNLISLTGSPGGKSIEEVPPPPMAPPLLWSSIDMVFIDFFLLSFLLFLKIIYL